MLSPKTRWRARCGLVLASLVGLLHAQPVPPLEHPSLESLREQLFPSAKTRGFRPTAAPSTDGLCGEAPSNLSATGRSTRPGSAAAAAAATRNLLPEPVPYAGERAPHVDLTINFPDSSDVPSPGSLEPIDTLAALLREPSLRVTRFAIAGHTDASGDEAINLRLSCARAIAVRRALLQRGIAPERLSAYGFGSQKLQDPAHATSAVNRRVEVRKAD